MADGTQERLQKVLAAAGVASRRDAETLISAGKVTVNGNVVREPGHKVDPERDLIRVEGRALPREVERLYLVLNKPRGYVTTREDPHAENTVMDLVIPSLAGKMGRDHPSVTGLHPVGRLDTQTEGLLILTNDGALTHALTHPRHRVPKLYVAEVRGIPTPEALEQMRTGVPLFGQRTLPARIRVARADRAREIATIEVELREGRNQQVRRMLQAVGHPVANLRRTRLGPITLGRLRPGQWRFLSEAEVEALFKASEPHAEEAEPEPETETRPRPRRPGGQKGRRTGPGPSTPRPAPPRGGKPAAGRGRATGGASRGTGGASRGTDRANAPRGRKPTGNQKPSGGEGRSRKR